MAKITPFKAVRPTRDKVSLVASRSYQSYTQAQREARLDNNPFSFLHIVNPGYKYAREITGVERYTLVKNRYLEFKEENIFIQDETPSFYMYKIVDRDKQVFHGIVAAASAEDYENNIIKKHEDTIEYKEIVFKDYLKTVGFNTEPVLLTYPDNKTINSIFNKMENERAEYEFTTTFRDTHYLWKIDDKETIKTIQDEFQNMETIYIADGHHRTSSSYLLSKDLKEKNSEHNGTEAYNYFMTFLIPESELKIHEFNRLVKDLNGLTKEEFLIKLDASFKIENRGIIPYKPTQKHHFSMYLDGEFYSLSLRKVNHSFSNSLDALDAQLLYNTILQPILGIEDLRNDTRINYLNGKKDIINLKSNIDNGDFAVGFGMVPVTIEEMKQLADDGLKMPPKSTYIEPKLRSGVTIYEF
ncbi:DUF1015 domain-containing protein [Oceanihabitans sediminis]|uniref:DUF1015 domain-containing protein n=1 Tax=Oceanihabitans sediminis TaxID=1812012 RepID=A0A368P5G5_9FLAO|nr:DUF1015 domain-containing protein [Oceanihabitans sediminis]MDX1279255.1 DUF1015 domain-containing protein [Oceanihabitans sediminis]MDX1773291.1 DUF1015 domain-containing protein [Oceanihabitans sediminis]RBP32722.1 uncharacterized protein (DUF1015 family) [Oceanihabitans sediminis]RCU57738.1 DUF1015 domain-containing protein [Oceanihabitans sediminis]